MKRPSKPPVKSSSPSKSRRTIDPVVPSLTAAALFSFLKKHDGQATKAEIIQHFNLVGQEHVTLRHLVQDMIESGQLEKNAKQLVKLAERPGAKSAPGYSFTGIFNQQRHGGGVVKSTQRQDKNLVTVNADDLNGAHNGDLVEVVNNKVVRVIAAHKDANFVSLLAIRNFDVPDAFPAEVISETQDMIVPELGNRTDLRQLPLVTIDGEDARDFDDAVHAVADSAADNKGGWVITVAIADVAHYVRPGSAIDAEAYKRGNSLYFPDRVVPMLPEALSNDMCSLRPDGPRACLAIIMRINVNGHMIGQEVVRGLMHSKARLTYTQVQHALDGKLDDTTKPLLADVLMPLYGAYKTLLNARQERGTIDLDVPERKIQLENGVVKAINQRERYESHKLIEEMMILANVAAATLLEEKHQPLLYRIHPKPDPMRLESTRNFLKEFGYNLRTGVNLHPKDFRQILRQTAGHDEELLINEIMLRTMSQAEYSPMNVGHFGLALERYAHFTSPIRRYADLIVHRALIKAYNLGNDGLTETEQNKLPATGQHISDRERVAQAAERETIDRYVALYLQDKVGGTFAGRISGVTKAGLFVTLDDTGADGLLPMRLLPQDFFEHDEQRHMLIGRRSGLTFRLAQKVSIELLETDSVTGRLVLQLAPGSYEQPAPRYRREKPEPHRERADEVRGPRGREPREPRKFGGKPDGRGPRPDRGGYERSGSEHSAGPRFERRDDRPAPPPPRGDEWQRPEKRNVERKVYTRSSPDERAARPPADYGDRPARAPRSDRPRDDFGPKKSFREDRPYSDRAPAKSGSRDDRPSGGGRTSLRDERAARAGAYDDQGSRPSAPRGERRDDRPGKPGGFRSDASASPRGDKKPGGGGGFRDRDSKPSGSGRGGPPGKSFGSKPPARGGGGRSGKPAGGGGRGR